MKILNENSKMEVSGGKRFGWSSRKNQTRYDKIAKENNPGKSYVKAKAIAAGAAYGYYKTAKRAGEVSKYVSRSVNRALGRCRYVYTDTGC